MKWKGTEEGAFGKKWGGFGSKLRREWEFMKETMGMDYKKEQRNKLGRNWEGSYGRNWK